jgi:hypothetical protein
MYICIISSFIGYPMKLIYFVTPYDLLDKSSNSPHAMTVEGIDRLVFFCNFLNINVEYYYILYELY